MKLLFLSAEPRELKQAVKRLLWARVRCGVGKDPTSSSLGVWVQEERDFPRALDIFMLRNRPRAVPYWAYLIDPPRTASQAAETRPEDSCGAIWDCGL